MPTISYPANLFPVKVYGKGHGAGKCRNVRAGCGFTFYRGLVAGRECLTNTFTKQGVYNPNQSPKEALRPFFELICRNCATPYPDYAPFV